MNTKSLLFSLAMLLSGSAYAQELPRCLTPEDDNLTAARPVWNKSVERSDAASRTFSGQLEVKCLLEAKEAHDASRLALAVSEVLIKKLTHDGTARAEDGSEVKVSRTASVVENPTEELILLREETLLAPEQLWANGQVKIYKVEEELQKLGESNRISLVKNVGLAQTADELLVISRTRPESIQVISDNADDQKYEKALKKLVEESYIKNVSAKGYEFSLRLTVTAEFPASEDNFSSLVSQLKNRLRKPLKEKLQTDVLPALAERL